MSTTFQPVRAASWYYHFAGLDSLALNRDRASKNILYAVQLIADAKKNADPRNVVIKSFFEAKAKELAEIFADYSDPSVFTFFASVDPNHQQVWDEARNRRK
jgi:pyruvate-formate lyase-activating enzyme